MYLRWKWEWKWKVKAKRQWSYIITIITNVLSPGRWLKCPVLSHHLLFRVRTFFQIVFFALSTIFKLVFAIIRCIQSFSIKMWKWKPKAFCWNAEVFSEATIHHSGTIITFTWKEDRNEWTISFIFLTLEFINNATQSIEKVDQLFSSQSKYSNLHSSHRISLNLNIKMIKITK